MFILCSLINKTNYDGTLLFTILSKFNLTSLLVFDGYKDEDIFMQLLIMPSIQETLEHFSIISLNIIECTSVIELLVEFKRIKTIKLFWKYSEDDELQEWKLEIKQIEKKLRKKHSEIEIDIDYQKI